MKTKIKALFVCIVLALVFSSISSVKASNGQAIRIGEVDRYATAAKNATTNWTTSDNVILVSGEVYADAVSGVPLAKKLDAPMILTTPGTLNTYAKTAIDTLKPKNIYIIGGNGSVSQSIRDQLRNLGYNLIELAGNDRYETNAAVADELVKLGVSPANVMVVSGEGFADALSAAPIAASMGQILLLGSNDNNSVAPILNFVKNSNSQTTVIGTNYVINDDIYKKLNAVKRINGGSDRFETNLNILNSYSSVLKNDKLFVANASGDGFADALIGSASAGKWLSPLVLVGKEDEQATSEALDYIKNTASSSTVLNVIGGTGVISDNLLSKLNSIILSKDDISVTPNGLNQIKIVFNTEMNRETAECVQNYQVDGVNLDTNLASAVLQDDKRTVLITFANPYTQFKNVVFTIKDSILDKDLNGIFRVDKNITFLDTELPKVQSLNVYGNNKIVIKFSEPIRISYNDFTSMKINDQSILGYGLDTSISTFYEKSGIWADGVMLYFNTPIKSGLNKFSISQGISGVKFDNAAGFPLQQTSVNFNVDSTNDSPIISSADYDSEGNLYITYNKVMDTKTALDINNYKINERSINPSYIGFAEGSNDKIVKISGVNNLIVGTNSIRVSDNVKDAYGNSIGDLNSISFNVEDNSMKPRIEELKMLDSQTIHLKFNKYVVNTYAVNKSNYELIDSNGMNITYKINDIVPSNGVNQNTNAYDIKFTKDNALTDSKYTIIIKNIIDTNIRPNVMDDYNATFSGVDDIAPKVTAIVQKAYDPQEVVIFFSKTMDHVSLQDISNYYFVDGLGDNNALPYNAVVTPCNNDNCVIIRFPSNYILKYGNDENHVVKIGVENVKDKALNVLAGKVYFDSISTDYTGGPSLLKNTVKFFNDGDDLKVQFTLTSALDNLNISDFKVAGMIPDSGTISDKNVILDFTNVFQNNVKINAIKQAGVDATLTIENPSSTDIAGRVLKAGSDKVYSMMLSPRTDSNLWLAGSDSGNNYVKIVFDEDIDDGITGLYYDDFVFTNERTGGKIDPVSVAVDGKNVVYKFPDGSIESGDKIDIHVALSSKDINIRSKKDANGENAVYIPSTYDLRIRTITAK